MSNVWFAATSKLNPGDVGVPAVNASSALNGILGAIYFWGGVVCVIGIIVAAFYYVISTGRPDKVKQAKNGIMTSVIGLVVILIAFAITQFVIGRF